MISKCANPKCNVDFHYLRGGRLYRFDLPMPTEPCKDVPNTICSRKPSHASVYFWLCRECAKKYSMRFSSRDGVSILPLNQDHIRGSDVVAHIGESA